MVSGVWNDFGLQMDLDPPLEGRLQEVEEEDNFSFRFYFSNLYFRFYYQEERDR